MSIHTYMYENLQIVTPPTTTPVSLTLAEAQCRGTLSVDSGLVPIYLGAATAMAEAYLKRTLVTTQYKLTRDFLPSAIFNAPTGSPAYNAFLNTSVYPYTLSSVLRLMKPPLISVDSIQYKDMTGNLQTLDPSLYVYETGTPGRIAPAYGKIFPFSLPQIASVVITYSAGYGFLQDGITPNIPYNIQAGILLLTGHLYKNREATTEGGMSELPYGVKELFETASPGFYR